MEETHKLLTELSVLDVKLTVEDGRLRYSAPKGALTPSLLERLKTHREEIVRLLEQLAADPEISQPPIPVLPRERGLPLSFAQQRLWFLDQLEGGNAATYNMPPVVLRIRGDLNIAALKRALDGIVRRHEVLRSAFCIQDEQPVQIPLTSVSVELPVLDLREVEAEQQQAAVDRIVREQVELPFDLRGGEVLLRATLIELDREEHVFSLTMHHIISDGWSIGIFVREISALYQGFTSGAPANLPPLPVQYADYAAWEQHRFDGPLIESHRQYWKEKLSGAPDLLELPADHPRPKIQRYRGRTEYLYFSPELTERLKAYCSESGVTLYMALLTTFATLLSRYTDQEDIVIGSPIAVRSHPQTEDLIGLFLNTLPLRIDLSGEPSLKELLQRVRQVSLEAFEHRELPLDQLLKELNLDRNLEHTPLFQVLFGLQNAPMGPMQLKGLTITPLPPQNLYAVFDLILNLEEIDGGLEGKLRGNSDLFERDSLRRMAGHYQALVEALVEDADASGHAVPLLTDDETRQLAAWSRPQETHQVVDTLPGLFERQVERAPEATALICADQSLTYRELNTRTNRLAHRLRELGVGPDTLVGIAADRSLEMVIGLLAILKAGGAYLPLDPTYPTERLRYMLEDSGVDVLLTRTHLRPSLPPLPDGVRLLDLDAEGADWADGNPENLHGDVAPGHLAYVIYTSGSTGRPKGVQVEQRQVVRLLTTTEPHFGFGPQDTWTLFHSYAFDFSVWELWGSLLYGGRLVVVPYEVSRSPEQFHQLVAEERVTVLNQTPSAFRQFIRADLDAERELSLKWVIFGGEALELGSLIPWVERHGDEHPRLINMYGITETTVHSSYRRITAADIAAKSGSVIGRPLRDLGLYLVDRHLQPVPQGVPGEILVGGGGVARGYLKRPELTAERFVPFNTCPFAARAGARDRLYRSGDLARWLPGGDLEYMGRIDQQVKIRGFRVELGEIEAILDQHPGVAEVIVNPVEDDSDGGKRLVAYVVPGDTAEPPAVADLREWAERSLAAYMVPAAFVLLERIPLTGNGKVDRRALPLPNTTRPELKSAFVTPTTPMERLIADRWSEILGIEQVGVNDNFFELGGDSIKGAIFVNWLQQELHSVVYVVALFEAPTVAELAAYLGRHYPEAAAALDGRQELVDSATPSRQIDEDRLAIFRSLIPPLAPLDPVSDAERNPRVIFVLSPPRSGSTLVRVVLGGHPQLFAPPELELLSFDNMADRRATYTGGLALYLEGTIRALMTLEGCDADEARAMIATREAARQPIAEFYRELQDRIDGRLLVDKTPSYALNREILERAECYFDRPLYIHLHRHPCGMIRSFEKASLEQIFFRHEHDFESRELAELIWLHSHHTIRKFLERIPSERCLDLSFEELTRQPRAQVERLCAFIDIPFTNAMLRPYEERQQRMTDGIYSESRMIGDTKFHDHAGIEAAIAEQWRGEYSEDSLGEPTREMARSLGYLSDGVTATAAAAIRRRRPSGEQPPSLAQQRLWFLDQLEGAGVAYSMPGALRIEGKLDRHALESSLQEIASRHETLRSQFAMRDGAPVVRIAESLPPISWIDLRTMEMEEQRVEVERLAREDAEKPFDLAVGPLFRSTLIGLAEDSHVVLINMHHIVSDGWSMGILTREWSELYNAFAANKAPMLPALPVQYSDYAQWQREYLTGAELRRQADYWRHCLDGAPALLELPTDRPRPPVQQYRGSTLDFSIPSSLVESLRRIGEETGASLFMVLSSVFGLLLSRYSGQRDVVIGSPTANRSRRELEPLIGFFVNTVALRLDVDPDATFRQLLEQTRQTALGAYAHQDISFEQLVEELKPERNLSHSPVFQVMFALQNTPTATPRLDGLTVSRLPGKSIVSKYDLTLMAEEREDGIAATFEYNTDLFDRATIERMANHLRILLDGLIASPERPVSRLPLLGDTERRQLLSTWNDTGQSLPCQRTIHGLIEAQVSRAPDAVAAEFGDASLTYAELDRQANQLAHYLRQRGAGPDLLVGLCLERSLEMLVGLLGILKSGAAYVPLDPSFPGERLAYIAADAGLKLVVTRTSLLDRLEQTTADKILLDVEKEAIAALGDTPTGVDPDPQSLAYAIYTSGSTGRPKGVMIEHLAAINFLDSMRRTPGLKSTDVLLAVTTISFDIAVLELYLPLMVGARVIIADDETAHDGALLARILEGDRVTCMQATPASWRMLLAAGWNGTPGLKALCGGESLSADLAAGVLERSDELWNMYGPTETTVWSTVQQIESDAVAEGAAMPIGRPIGNTTIYILDSAGNPTPTGVAGELCIGGLGLARGYHERSELTQEKFIRVDFGTGAAERIYRTGDRARYWPAGTIECLGRLDNQVKVRGFRIEPGEVEAALEAHPAVAACGVIADRQEGEGRLVAFFSRQADQTVHSGELRQSLRRALPEYMVPSLFIELEALPLTPNGKVDRHALQIPGDAGSTRKAAGESRDPIELQLVDIWEDLLDIRPIGVRDNFFDLGGHSLVAVRLMARVAQQFGRVLPLAALFQGATVEQLALLLREDAPAGTWNSLVPVRSTGSKNPVFCVAGAGGNVVYFHDLARQIDRERPFYALQPPGLDGTTSPLTTVEELAAHYLDAIRAAQERGPYLLAGHSFGGLVAFAMTRLLRQSGEEVDRLLLLDAAAPHFQQPTGRDWDEARWLSQVADIVGHLYSVPLEIDYETLASLAPEKQLEHLHARLVAEGVLPPGSDVVQLRGFVEVYKANLRAECAIPDEPIDAPVTLFRSRELQPDQLVAETAAQVRAEADLGWERYVNEEVEVRIVPGDHLTMMRPPQVASLARSIGEALDP